MDKVRFLIVSDLHAVHSASCGDDSRLQFQFGESEYGAGFIEYAKELNIDVDALVCPGDISNKGDTKGFQLGWIFLNQIKKVLNIPEILCVPGNHDHQSRTTSGVFDPKHHLQFINPPFPFSSLEKNTHFWSWHWCHSVFDHFNVISLNTSAYHGYGEEFEHGRIATEISDQISKYINSDRFGDKAFNLLVCHHHPEKMDYVDGDYDSQAMEGGSNLIRKLDESSKGPWLIIHGHKHFADIVYARTVSSCPTTIFSAGSLSAKLYPSINARTENQFYLVEVDLNKTKKGDRLVGQFRAFERSLSSGWQPSKSDYLPSKGGFGNNISPKVIVDKIIECLEKSPPFLNREDLMAFDKELQYFTPSDFKQLINKLRAIDLEVIVESNRIIQIGRAHD